MILGEIYQAMESWRALAALKMQPRMAYKVLKYVKLVSAEWDIVEKQRVALVHEITGTTEGQDAKIEPGTQEFVDYVTRLNEILATKSDLASCPGSLEKILDAIKDSDDNALSIQDLALMEPFFSEEQEEPPVVAGSIG